MYTNKFNIIAIRVLFLNGGSAQFSKLENVGAVSKLSILNYAPGKTNTFQKWQLYLFEPLWFSFIGKILFSTSSALLLRFYIL